MMKGRDCGSVQSAAPATTTTAAVRPLNKVRSILQSRALVESRRGVELSLVNGGRGEGDAQ